MNNTQNYVRTHRPIVITSAGNDDQRFDPRDTAKALHQQVNNLVPTSLSNIRKVVGLFQGTSFGKLKAEVPSKGDLFEDLISDSPSMRIFLRAFGRTRGYQVNEELLPRLNVEVTRLGDEFFMTSSIPLQAILHGQEEIDGWDQILPFVQDYAYDLHLSQARSADVITSDVNSLIASERIDLSINRALKSAASITSFEEFVFGDARAFREAINTGRMPLHDALKLIDETAKFRSWLCGLPPDAGLIKEFHQAVNKDTALGSLPAKFGRFATFTGPGLALDLLGAGGVGTALGLTLSAVDTFVIDGLLRGWRPNHFVAKVRKALETTDAR